MVDERVLKCFLDVVTNQIVYNSAGLPEARRLLERGVFFDEPESGDLDGWEQGLLYLIYNTPLKSEHYVTDFLITLLLNQARSDSVRAAAGQMLGLQKSTNQAWPMIRALFADPSLRVQRVLATELGRLDSDHAHKGPLGALTFVLRSDDFDVRMRAYAAESLGAIGLSASSQILIESLSSPHADIRFFAARSLGWLGEQRALGILLKMAKEDKGEVEALGADGRYVAEEARLAVIEIRAKHARGRSKR